MIVASALESVINLLIDFEIAVPMQRARMISFPLPKDATDVKLTQREWGIERSYKTSKGNKIQIAASFVTIVNS